MAEKLYSLNLCLNFASVTDSNRHDMIKKHGVFEVHKDGADLEELIDSVDALPEGTYEYVIFDQKKNRSLPQLKYLFGIILKTISDKHPDHPTVDTLYRYFEAVYAPIHVCEIDGEKFEYFDLKNENKTEVDDFIQKVVHHATSKWGIKFVERDFLKLPEARELFIDANYDLWKRISQNSSSAQT